MIDWNDIYKNGGKFSHVSEILLDTLELKGRTALDIGCGNGELTRQLAGRGFEVTGIDLSDVAIDKARKEDNQITYVSGDFMHSSLGKFDVVFVNKVLAFSDDPEIFLTKVRDHCLNTNGILVLTTPVLFSGYKYDKHTTAISMDYDQLTSKLKSIFKQNVKLVDKRYYDLVGCEATFVCTKTSK